MSVLNSLAARRWFTLVSAFDEIERNKIPSLKRINKRKEHGERRGRVTPKGSYAISQMLMRDKKERQLLQVPKQNNFLVNYFIVTLFENRMRICCVG